MQGQRTPTSERKPAAGGWLTAQARTSGRQSACSPGSRRVVHGDNRLLAKEELRSQHKGMSRALDVARLNRHKVGGLSSLSKFGSAVQARGKPTGLQARPVHRLGKTCIAQHASHWQRVRATGSCRERWACLVNRSIHAVPLCVRLMVAQPDHFVEVAKQPTRRRTRQRSIPPARQWMKAIYHLCRRRGSLAP